MLILRTILMTALIFPAAVAHADEPAADPPQEVAEQAVDATPAGANAAADVTESSKTSSDEVPAAPREASADHEESMSKTLERMKWIESLPIVIPRESTVAPAPAEPMDPKAALNHRMAQLLAEPEPTADPQAVQSQLMDLTNNASQLALLNDPGPQQFEALSVQMQALYAQMVEARDTADIDRLLSRLRSAARRTKAIDLPDAQPVGDFWLLTAELFDLNRTPLPSASRHAQAAQLMDKYLTDHPEAAPSDAVRSAYQDLQKVRGIEVEAPEVPEATQPPED